ncbi:MAG: SH3 domain-containing protein [Nitrospinae bacterium]|nr:SH3 domain-containing protein [Nitrospinota bacterium]
MTRTVRFVLPLLLAALLVPSAALAEPLLVKLKEAKMRSGPATSYDVLWILPKGWPLEGLARYKDWWAVRRETGHVGWLHNDSLEKGKGAVVVNEKANMREGAGTEKKMTYNVPKNYVFKVLDQKENWYKLTDGGAVTGWIYGPLVWVNY